MTSLNKVFGDLPVTVFEAMSQAARDNNAINLGQGFPDDPGPEDIRRAAAEAYPGGVVVPLSSFDPGSIPDPQGKEVVFACRSGKRSVTASLAAQAAGLPYDKHLAGGILGWKAAGLPTRTGG